MSERKINHDISIRHYGQPAPKHLTDGAKQSYLQSPNHCPYCNSIQLDSGPLESGDDISANVHCGNCGKNWTDIYSVTDIREVL